MSQQKARPSRQPDITGVRFGRLVPLRMVRRSHGSRFGYDWECQCDCGAVKVLRTDSLRRGQKSCGVCAHGNKRFFETRPPGKKPPAEYGVWAGIVKRTENQNTRNYASYGGRGINMCARWRASYEAFVADVGQRPSPDHSIDRIENDGGYWCGKCDECVSSGRPPNCRWATRVEQALNRRSNRRYPFRGQLLTVTEIARALDVSPGFLFARLDKLGWDPSRAFEQPLDPRWVRGAKHERVLYEFRGERLLVSEIARRVGIDAATIRNRLKRGWDPGQAFTLSLQDGIRRRGHHHSDAPAARRAS